MDEWTIFCPGISLYKLERSDLKANFYQSIAVNGAILKRIPVRYWALSDYEVFISCLKIMEKRELRAVMMETILWVSDNWPTHIKKWAPDFAFQFGIFKYEVWPISNLASIMPFAKRFKWEEFTFFSAIALAILKGAKKINVYGADFEGAGYFKPGLENSRTIHTEKRWKDEWDKFNKLQAICKKRGIEIVRIKIV